MAADNLGLGNELKSTLGTHEPSLYIVSRHKGFFLEVWPGARFLQQYNDAAVLIICTLKMTKRISSFLQARQHAIRSLAKWIFQSYIKLI